MPVIPLWFHVLLICVLPCFALVRGDREALIGMTYTCASTGAWIGVVVSPIAPHISWMGVDLAWSLVDFSVLYTLSILSRRGWTLALGGVVMLPVVTNLLAVFIRWPTWVIGTALIIWYFLQCIVLVIGCLRSKPDERVLFRQQPASIAKGSPSPDELPWGAEALSRTR